MNLKTIVSFILIQYVLILLFENFTVSGVSLNESTSALSRKKRYIVFPKGASLQLVYCNSYTFRPVVDIFKFGTTVGLAWPLPDDPKVYSDSKKKHRIYRRNILKKTEKFVDSLPGDYDGRQCVLKALCESGQRTPSRKQFVLEILNKIFSAIGDDSEDDEESHEDVAYRKAYDSVNQNCDTLYPKCNFSFFKFT